MKDEIKFSIIVPVYNAERYIERCCKSVIRQTYKNRELIIVNDGSNDGSESIVKDLIKIDDRIEIYNQNNMGPGTARNNGINYSTGSYIVLLDADDYITSDYLELLYPRAKTNDIVFIDVNQVDLNGNLIKEEKMSIYSSMEKSKILRKTITGTIPWGGVRKCVSKDLIINNNIGFSNSDIGEELIFSFDALYYAESIDFLSNKSVYMYEIHEVSQSTKKNDDPWGNTYETIRNHICKLEIYDDFANTLNAFNITSTLVSIDRITNYYKGNERIHKIKNRLKLFKKRWNKGYFVDLNSITIKSIILIPFLLTEFSHILILASKIKKLVRGE